MTLTQQQFAQCCAYIAKSASAWAGDTLDCEGDVSPETAARFTDHLRARVDWIDHQVARQASPAPYKWLGPYKDPQTALDALRRAVAEVIGADPETWPDHGNAPLAIAAICALAKRAEVSPPPGTTALEALKAAIEGECDGLAIDDAQATTILSYVAQAERAEDAEPFAWWAETGTAGTGDNCNKLFFMRELAVEHVRKYGGHVVTVYRGPPKSDPSPDVHKFQIGDRVQKTKGSSWRGRVVGFYSTALTPIGYAVESENEPGSVQIYPESALEVVTKSEARG